MPESLIVVKSQSRWAIAPTGKTVVKSQSRWAIDLFADSRILAITSLLSDDKQALALEVLRLSDSQVTAQQTWS